MVVVFQVVPPCGGHPVMVAGIGVAVSFQVVPPCGGHPSPSTSWSRSTSFQVVPPCGGHQGRSRPPAHGERVSSRAPVWGASRGFNPGHLDWLDSLTVYKDRRAYPHKLANAIIAYELEDKVQNSHRAIDDVLALFEVLKAMDEERDDLCTYVNLFGYNPKYGVSGRRITGVRYEPQGFSKTITRPEQTLPARMSRR
mgnify:CR=1 FL=1